jgi:hypothetical protein
MSEIQSIDEVRGVALADFTPKRAVHTRIHHSKKAQMCELTKLVEKAYEKNTPESIFDSSATAPAQNVRRVYYRLLKNESAATNAKEAKIQRQFRKLADAWRLQTAAVSSTSEIVSNFYYYQIIGLGEGVVPYILRELESKGGQWYLALRAITNENPVPDEEIGNIKKMKAAWLKWGRERGLI